VTRPIFLFLIIITTLTACGLVTGPTPLAGSVDTARVTAPHPTLTTGAPGVAADLIPTQDEIDLAKAVLGPEGFIGMIACTLNTDYHATVATKATAIAAELGLKFELFDAQVKAEKQVKALKEFTAKGARVIILCALNPKVVGQAVEEATKTGVFIVQFAGAALPEVKGISVGTGDEDVKLGCAAGEIAGDLITREKGGKAIVALLDYPDLPQIVLRADNIEKCLLAKAPHATVVGRFLGGTTDNGLLSMNRALKEHPEIDVVASINDAGAYGAMTALQAAGKDPQTTLIVGIDAETKARDLIKAGSYYRGTVNTSPEITGEIVINGAVKLLASATVPKIISVPANKVTLDSLP
jgi:ribose transport system substrate-binding protein